MTPTRRALLASALVGSAAAALPRRPRRPRPRRERPNIVIILADDMGWSDIGCYGGEIQTPNLDRLAAGGLRFTQFYNSARCCPTRAALLTGLHPQQAGMGGMVSGKSSVSGDPEGPYQGWLSRSAVTIAEALAPAGYRRFMAGKWHIGEHRPDWPCDRGFEHYFGLISGAGNYWDPLHFKGERQRQMALDHEPYEPDIGDFYLTDAITDHACQYATEGAADDDPFFLYLAYTAPHWPLHAWPEDIERYRGVYRDGWEPIRAARHRRQLELGLVDPSWALSPADAADWGAVADQHLQSLRMQVYAAQIDRMDQGIGRLLTTLERAGQLERTLLLFLSDNGGCHEGGPLGFDRMNNGAPPGGIDSYQSYGQSWANASNTPFRKFKHWVHEGGCATPLIAHWPGAVAAGGVTDQPGHIIDLMATCLEVAGADYPAQHAGRAITPLEGRSLVPILGGGTREPHPELCWEHMGNRAIRVGDRKLVMAKDGPWELYDLAADRTELHNLATERPDEAAALLERWRRWAAKVGARVE